MNRLFSIKVLALVMLLFTSCSKKVKDIPEGDNNTDGVEEPILPQKEISKIIDNGIRAYLEVDGIPFPLLGAQIRLDALVINEKQNLAYIEQFFAKAKELHVNCVQIPIWWNNIEPIEDKYDFSLVDDILSLANKHELKIELLWFSTNMIGGSYSHFVPTYVSQKTDKRLWRSNDGNYTAYYGYVHMMILDDEWVLEREKKAVTRLFNHIRYWDSENGEKHPVISAQIHNEPDGLVKRTIDEYEIRYRDGRELTKEQAWSMTLNALDAIGKAVKNSSYKVATRTNLMRANGVDPFPTAPNAKPQDVFDLEGIDFVNVDPYYADITNIEKEVLAYRSIAGNYPLMAENKGTYQTSPSLILKTVSLGGGYNIYDLATSKFFLDNAGGNPDVDHGIYTWDLQERGHTRKTGRIIKGLVAASPDLVLVNDQDFMTFNISQDMPAMELLQTVQSSKAIVDFRTTNAAIGFALDLDGYLLVYSSDEATFEFRNGTVVRIDAGYYDARGNFVVEQSEIPTEVPNVLKTDGSVLYKIVFNSEGELGEESGEVLYNGDDVNISWIPYSKTNNGDLSTLPDAEISSEVNNPDRTGVNKSLKSLKFLRGKNANQWPGIDSRFEMPVTDLADVDKISMMVNKEVAGPVLIEIRNEGNTRRRWLQGEYTESGQWQIVEFDFDVPVLWSTVDAPENLHRLIVSVHYVDNTGANALTEHLPVYIDNIIIHYKQ